MSFMRWGCLLALLASGCSAASDDAGTSEQNGTAGNDLEVARLREMFKRADRGVGDDDLALSSRSPTGMKSLWQCERREASLGSPSVATPVNYSFTRSNDPGIYYVNGEGSFGRYFRLDNVGAGSDGLLGYPASSGASAIGEYQSLRAYYGEVIMEHIKRPTVASLGPADQAEWDALARRHDVAINDGLAVAYTHCFATKRSVGNEPVIFYDDFADSNFTYSHGSSGTTSPVVERPFKEAQLEVSGITANGLRVDVGGEVEFSSGMVSFNYARVPLALPVDSKKHRITLIFTDDALLVKVDETKASIARQRAGTDGSRFVFNPYYGKLHSFLLK